MIGTSFSSLRHIFVGRGERVVESLGMVYKCHYPHYAKTTARNVKLSPLHARQEALGAYFRDVSGWEGADWYAGAGQDPAPLAEKLSWGRHEWWHLWEREHRACREGVALIDMSFFGLGSFAIAGPASVSRAAPHTSAIVVSGFMIIPPVSGLSCYRETSRIGGHKYRYKGDKVR